MRFTIYDRPGGAGINGIAVPQSARCAGKQRRSATLSTVRRGTCVRPPAAIPAVSGDFRRFPEIFKKIMKTTAADFRYAIYDLRSTWRRGDQWDGHASKCPLRGQTTPQRDIVHHQRPMAFEDIR
jgi:hypothetical protein